MLRNAYLYLSYLHLQTSNYHQSIYYSQQALRRFEYSAHNKFALNLYLAEA